MAGSISLPIEMCDLTKGLVSNCCKLKPEACPPLTPLTSRLKTFSRDTQKLLQRHIEASDLLSTDYWFTSTRPPTGPLTSISVLAYRSFVKEWVAFAVLNPAIYGTHSIRRARCRSGAPPMHPHPLPLPVHLINELAHRTDECRPFLPLCYCGGSVEAVLLCIVIPDRRARRLSSMG